MSWVRRSSRYLFESAWFKLRQDELTLPAGDEITYTIVEHPGFAVVVPMLEDGRVVMERIYRYTVGRTLLECPSGGREEDDPESCARRELEEETGYRAGQLTHLGRFVASSGISDEEYDAYLATELTSDGRMQREVTEEIELELVPLPELRSMVLRGEVEDGPSALAILLAVERIG